MRRTITTLLTVGVLALPVAQQAGAAVKTTKKVVTKRFTGAAYQADRWGSLQVTITVRANISLVSGASDSSQAFAESLQSAILKAKRA